jgi:hypothetical protein
MCMYVCLYVIECVRVGVLENACVRAFGCEHVRVSMTMCVYVCVCVFTCDWEGGCASDRSARVQLDSC